MPPCRDPLVSLLNSWDFNALRIPRTDYVPGSVLMRSHDGAIALWGALGDAFQLRSPLPVTEGAVAEHFQGASTANYRIGLATKLLSEWLGVAPSGLASGFRGARRISYHIEAMRLLATPVGEIGRVMASAETADSFGYPDRARLFVVSEALQAKRVVLQAQDQDSGAVSVDASVVPTAPASAGRASFSVEGGKSAEGILELRFTDYHTIGFKAHEVEVADGEYGLVVGRGSSGMSHMDRGVEEAVPVVFPLEPWL